MFTQNSLTEVNLCRAEHDKISLDNKRPLIRLESFSLPLVFFHILNVRRELGVENGSRKSMLKAKV